MSSHDKYSSDEESTLDIGVSSSRVLLGFNDGSFDDETPGIQDTFIGGQPIWLHPNLRPDDKMVTCDNCGDKMALFLQAYAPFPDELYDRVIYIFGCKNTSTCQRRKGTIKAVRGIRKDPKRIDQFKKDEQEQLAKLVLDKMKVEQSIQRQLEMTRDIFGQSDTCNPFDSNPFENAFDANRSASASNMENLNTGSVKTNTCSDKDESNNVSIANSHGFDRDFPYYPGSFVYVEPETIKKRDLGPELEKYRHLIEENDAPQQETALNEQVSAPAQLDQTLKIQDMLDDRHFQSFSETVGHNPGQVLRYDLGGRPLLYSGRDATAKRYANSGKMPIPSFHPHSERQFELQLMPKTIIDLEKSLLSLKTIQDYIATGMEWGTIIVATDKEDYIPHLDRNNVGYVLEWCAVQWEESV